MRYRVTRRPNQIQTLEEEMDTDIPVPVKKTVPPPMQKWVKSQIVRCGKRFGCVTEAKFGRVIVSFPHKELDSGGPEIITFRNNGTILGNGEVVLFNNEAETNVLDATCIALNERLREVARKMKGNSEESEEEETE